MTTAFIRSSMEVAYDDAQPYLASPIDLTVPNPPPSVNDCKRKVKELSRLLLRLEPIVAQMDNGYANWNSLRAVMSADEREADNPVMAKFLTDYDYMRTLADLKKYVQDIFLAKEDFSEFIPAETGLGPTPVAPAAVTAPSSHPEDVVLRPLEIPKFYGDLHEWPAWWECYEYAIHNTNKAKAYKLILLKSALGREAKSAIAQVSGDGAGYDDAIKILKEEFGNERAIKKNLYYKLQTIRPAQDNRVDLRRFIDEVDQICSSLERMGEDVNSLSFVTGLQDRLPKHIRRKLINEEKSLPPGTEWTTARLRKKIREIVKDEDEIERSMSRMSFRPERERSLDSRDRAREPSEHFRSSRIRSESPSQESVNSFRNSMSLAQGEFVPRPDSPYAEDNVGSRSGPGPTMSFLGAEIPVKSQYKAHPKPGKSRQNPHFWSSKTSSDSISPSRDSNCFFCGLYTHTSEFCPLESDDRKVCVMQRQLCFKCLKVNHYSSQCTAKCENCGSNHHKWLCPSNWKHYEEFDSSSSKATSRESKNPNNVPLDSNVKFGCSPSPQQKKIGRFDFANGKNPEKEEYESSDTGQGLISICLFSAPEKQ